MLECGSILEMMEFLSSRHGGRNPHNYNRHAMLMLRKHSGRRVIFQSISGFKILDYETYGKDELTIKISFPPQRGNSVLDCSIFLHDLVLINGYDEYASFFSHSSIDFAYCMTDYLSSLVVSGEWVRNRDSPVRAFWKSHRKNIEESLDEIGCGRKILRPKRRGRGVMLDLP